MPRTKSHVVKNSAILPQRDFAFGAAIEIIEHRLRQSPPRNGAEIVNANHSRRCDSARRHGNGSLGESFGSPISYHSNE
jgi:hypothetical protein